MTSVFNYRTFTNYYDRSSGPIDRTIRLEMCNVEKIVITRRNKEILLNEVRKDARDQTGSYRVVEHAFVLYACLNQSE